MGEGCPVSQTRVTEARTPTGHMKAVKFPLATSNASVGGNPGTPFNRSTTPMTIATNPIARPDNVELFVVTARHAPSNQHSMVRSVRVEYTPDTGLKSRL